MTFRGTCKTVSPEQKSCGIEFMNLPFAVGIAYICGTSLALAEGCPGQVFSGKNELTKPSSVRVADIPGFVESASWSDGIRVTALEHGDDVLLDVVEFPGTTSVAAASRVVWLIGRVMDTDAKNVVFVDKSESLFAIDAVVLKNIGCRFVIGEAAGENPIALMREFYDAVVYSASGKRIAPVFTGSLLGDTSTAMVANNEVFVPGWVASAVK